MKLHKRSPATTTLTFDDTIPHDHHPRTNAIPHAVIRGCAHRKSHLNPCYSVHRRPFHPLPPKPRINHFVSRPLTVPIAAFCSNSSSSLRHLDHVFTNRLRLRYSRVCIASNSCICFSASSFRNVATRQQQCRILDGSAAMPATRVMRSTARAPYS